MRRGVYGAIGGRGGTLTNFASGEDNGFFAVFNTAVPAAGKKDSGVFTELALASIFDMVVGNQKLVRNRSGTYDWIAAGTLPVEVDATGKSYLVIEPAKINYLIRSQTLDNAAFTKSNCSVTADAATAPDGTSTADRVVFSSATASIRQTGIMSAAVPSSGPVSFTGFLKSSSAMTTTQRITPAGAGSPAPPTASPTDILTTWSRLLRQLTASGGMTSVQAWLIDFTQTFDAWGLQMEIGNPTSYIPTVAASASRAADQISFDLSDIPSLGSEFSVYIDCEMQNTPTVLAYLLSLSDETTNECAAIRHSSAGAISQFVRTGGADQADTAGGANMTTATRRQISARFKANDCAISVDGAAVVKDTSVSLPTVTKATLGARFGTTDLTGEVFKVNRFAIVSRGVSDADLPNWRYSTDSGPFDVILVAGQSNAVGRGSPLDTGTDVGGSNVFQWTQSAGLARIAAGNDPLDHIDENDLVGPAVAFARWYAANVLAAGRKVLLVPRAQGGTAFRTNDWNPGDAVYEAAVAATKSAIASTPGNRLVAVMWQHGETDSDFDASVAAYPAAFAAMKSDFESRVAGASSAKWLVGGMCPDWITGAARRQTMQAFLASLPGLYSNVEYADPSSPSELTGNLDANIHYSAANQRIMGGERYATAWQS